MQLLRFPKSKRLPTSAHFHWPRRLFHAASGVGIVLISFLFENKQIFVLTLLVITIAELAFELWRLRSPAIQSYCLRFFSKLMREGEEKRISGIPYYAIGVTVSFIIFPRQIAVLSVLFLALGDPAASIVGIFSKRGEKVSETKARKSLAGTMACFFICWSLAFFLFPWLFPNEMHFWLAVLFATVGGASAALAEFLPFRTDDNLSLPVVSGALLWLFASLLGLVPGLVS